MIGYKLMRPGLTAYGGYQFEIGRRETITRLGAELCTNQVFHFYKSPELAALLAPIHCDPDYTRLLEIECDLIASDGLKGATKWLIPVRDVDLPRPTIEQRVAFGILCALEVRSNRQFIAWAERWLSGKDRTADAAADAAYAAAYAADAAYAAYAAGAAARAAHAAGAAARAARAAARAARAAVAMRKGSINLQSLALRAFEHVPEKLQ